ncbi:MAG: hypothetical protein ACLQVX_13250 [Limisphaerales bacterium]
MSDALPEPGSPRGVSPGIAWPHLDRLAAQLPNRALVYACLLDLFEHGPIGTRGDPVVSRPSRSDIAHFLAKWARAIGLSQEACLDWLTHYALGALAAISTTSPGAIRHNIKGIVKFVYSTGYPFNCGKEHNAIHCRCDPQCPVYHQAEAPLPKPGALSGAADAEGTQRIGRVKDHYREQYEKSLLVIREMRAAGRKSTEIIERLNGENLPTKTGRKWSSSCLNLTLKTLERAARPR